MVTFRNLALITVSLLGATYLYFSTVSIDQWSAEEWSEIQSMEISNLQYLDQSDSTNQVVDNPEARKLGHRLFFDSRLSSNGKVACASCHNPDLAFTDGLNTSVATGVSKRNAPSLIGSSFSPWFYWDGRKDSLWSQALSPLEDPAEHAGNRTLYAKLIHSNELYKRSYETIFGRMPNLNDPDRFPKMVGPFNTPENQEIWQGMGQEDRIAVNEVFSNIGKVLAAYQKILAPGPSRFDEYVSNYLSTPDGPPTNKLTPEETRGLKLFVGKAACTNCHNGPLLTNNSFHNTGLLSPTSKLPDVGRIKGIRAARKDSFNCLGYFSDDNEACMELLFAKTDKSNLGAFRTPSLRNVELTAPYGHAGQQKSLEEVLRHYNEAPNAMIGHNEAKPLGLWPWELAQLESFLRALNSPPIIDKKWLGPPS